MPGGPAYEVFVRPAVLATAGHTELHRPTVTATVNQGWCSPAGRREFARVLLTGSQREGRRVAPAGPPGTLQLSALARSHALAVVPENVTDVTEGATLSCLLLDA